MLEAGHQAVYGDDAAAKAEHNRMLKCSRVLLWLTKRPPSADEDTASMVVEAIDGSCLAGAHLPKSLDDKQGLSELGRQLRSWIGTAPPVNATYSARAFSLQDHIFAEISVKGAMTLAGHSSPVPWCESMMTTELGKFWVGFLFVSNTPADIEHMKDLAKIAFASPAN